MAAREIYIGFEGPFLYDDSDPLGSSPDQVVTKGDLADISLSESQIATVTALDQLSTLGLVGRTGTDTFTTRSVVGTPGEVEVTNGDGLQGDITIGLPAAIKVNALEADSLRVNQIVYAVGSNIPTHRIPININGVQYFMLLQST